MENETTAPQNTTQAAEAQDWRKGLNLCDLSHDTFNSQNFGDIDPAVSEATQTLVKKMLEEGRNLWEIITAVHDAEWTTLASWSVFLFTFGHWCGENR